MSKPAGSTSGYLRAAAGLRRAAWGGRAGGRGGPAPGAAAPRRERDSGSVCALAQLLLEPERFLGRQEQFRYLRIAASASLWSGGKVETYAAHQSGDLPPFSRQVWGGVGDGGGN